MSQPPTRWRLPRGLTLLAAVALLVAVVVVVAVVQPGSSDPAASGDGSGAAGGPGGGKSSPAPRLARAKVTVSLTSAPVSPPIPAGFLGLSIEFQAVRAYTGPDPSRVNPVLVQLIRNLTPGQAPVIRIGGDSTDASWVPTAGLSPPPEISYNLTRGWFATTRALAQALGARLILGVNLAANSPPVAAAEGRAYVRNFGSTAIDALEIGNEPNVYGKIALFRSRAGTHFSARPSSYDYPAFAGEFDRERVGLPPLALAGPALAAGPVADPGSWIQSLASFAAGEPRLKIVTLHRYPLRNCFVGPSSHQYPSISHLLTPFATVGLADSVKPYLAIAHAHHRAVRVDELNSVACRGKAGVSDTFAASLWSVDALFALARIGVDGVNLHTLPRSAYELFRFSRRDGRWRAFVTPVYYGLQMFASAAPAGSRLLRVTGAGRAGVVVWATRAPDGLVRAVVINERSRSRRVTLRAPRGGGGSAILERLRAPGVRARSGVTIGAQSFGTQTYTGRLAPASTQTVRSQNGTFTIAVPRYSAALLTFSP